VLVGVQAFSGEHAGMDSPDSPPSPTGGPLPGWLAVVLVVGTSGAVLVLEILAGRLMAPYVGVSLETYTGIIGTVLAGIAIGAWAGGELADRIDPRRLIPLLLLLGGALAIASIPLVRLVGEALGEAGAPGIVMLAAIGFLPSATVLSGVPPAVVKLQLRTLAATGTTVGRLSAWGTAGAIVATFLTGFVLVAWAAVTTLIVAVGIALIVSGIALAASSREQAPAGDELLAVGGLAAVALLGVAAVDAPCDTQTAYYCVSILDDPDNPSGRTLVLDDLRHSYVDLEDPTNLQFWYVQRLVDAIEAYAPAGQLDITYLGGGGLTIPRYVRATRPGSVQTVHEIDGDLADIVTSDLGLEPAADIRIDVGDARLRLADRVDDSADVVIGDAFGSRAVPWHLATEEFIEEIDRVLRPGGLYAANIIDEASQDFLRAEAATIRRVLPHVAIVLGPSATEGFAGNSVIVASDEPFDATLLDATLGAEDGRRVADVDDYLDGATILTDDFAPVDQLISRGS
jgi:spermidine synthase